MMMMNLRCYLGSLINRCSFSVIARLGQIADVAVTAAAAADITTAAVGKTVVVLLSMLLYRHVEDCRCI